MQSVVTFKRINIWETKKCTRKNIDVSTLNHIPDAFMLRIASVRLVASSQERQGKNVDSLERLKY